MAGGGTVSGGGATSNVVAGGGGFTRELTVGNRSAILGKGIIGASA